MQTKTKPCKWCQRTSHYSFQCFENPKRELQMLKVRQKQRKPIKQQGKRAIAYKDWRDTVAIPYLDKTFGRICAACKGARCHNQNLDVDHIKERGSHPELIRVLSNVQYLGRFPCHSDKTDRKVSNS